MSHSDIDRIRDDSLESAGEAKGKKSKKRRAIIIIITFLVVAAVLTVGFIMYGKKSYKAVVEAYMEAHIAGDYDGVIEIRSGFYDAAIEMKESETVEALILNVKSAMKTQRKHFDAALGEDYTVTYEITSAEKMDRSVFEAMVNRFTIIGYKAGVEMKDAMIVDIEVIGKSEIDERTEYLTLILTKESDGWKFFGVEGDYS